MHAPRRNATTARGVVAAVAITFAFAGSSTSAAVAARRSASPPGVSRYIVVARSARDATSAAATVATLGGQVKRSYTHSIDGFSADLTPRAAAVLARQPGVESVEHNQTFHPTTTQNNPTWGLDRIDQHNLPLDQSYTYAQSGSGVTAYVIDSGIDAAQSEFTGRINTGYNAFDGLTDTADNCIGHGTHVSGTIGGTTFGVAKAVHITPVLVFDCGDDTTSETIITALDWVVADHQPGVPAVLNMSLGGPYDGAVNAATTSVVDDGIFVSVAAGNDDMDACQTSPASALGVVTVGAVDQSDTRAFFSNYGSCVDIFAPGVNVTSAANTGGFVTFSGTSMASPHVAGAAARYLSAHPAATPGQVATALLGAATSGVVTDPGTGSPNELLWADPTDSVPLPSADATAPSVPANVSAAALDEHSVDVKWDASSDNVGVGGYRIFRDGAPNPVGSTRTTEFVDTDAQLAPSTTYTYTVEAVDRAGNASSASSAANATTSSYAPLPPFAPLGAQVAPFLVEIPLVDVNEPGVVTSIDVDRDGQPVGSVPVDPTSPDGLVFDDPAVTPGTTYAYTFRAVDEWGDIGAFSAALSVTIPPDLGPPSTPSVRASALDASRIHLSWSHSADDVIVAGYRVYRGTKLIKTLAPYVTSFTDTGLHANTTYRYSVRAFDEVNNMSGAGHASATTDALLDGYWMVGRDGHVFAFDAGYYGSDVDELGAMAPAAAGIASRADGRGYWIVDQAGRVFAHGDARYFGNANLPAGDQAIAIVATPSGHGYWVATNHGRVFAFGDAPQLGPTSQLCVAHPIVAMTATPSGRGYWLTATDGGVFGYGDARYFGSTARLHLRRPIVTIAATPSGRGYWLISSDGGVFTFGDAGFFGSCGHITLHRPIIGITVAPGGRGYLLAASDGGIFSFGSARFEGALGGTSLRGPIIGLARS